MVAVSFTFAVDFGACLGKCSGLNSIGSVQPVGCVPDKNLARLLTHQCVASLNPQEARRDGGLMKGKEDESFSRNAPADFDLRPINAMGMDGALFTKTAVRRYRSGRRNAFFEDDPEQCLVSFFEEGDFYVASVTEISRGEFVIGFECVSNPAEEIWYHSFDGRCSYKRADEEHGTMYPSLRNMVDAVRKRPDDGSA